MSGTQQRLIETNRAKSSDEEVVETEVKRGTISVKFTKLGDDAVHTLDVVAGTKLSEVLEARGAASRGEIYVSRYGKSMQLDRTAELQEDDKIVWVPNQIRGGV